jgi:hypothetical protein
MVVEERAATADSTETRTRACGMVVLDGIFEFTACISMIVEVLSTGSLVSYT